MSGQNNRFQRSLLVAPVVVALLALGACGTSSEREASLPTDAVLFEGARIIAGGDEAPIQNGAFVVAKGRFVAVGAAGDVSAPEGTRQVDLSGKTVIPAIVDAHTHLSTNLEALLEDLRSRAYYGVVSVRYHAD